MSNKAKYQTANPLKRALLRRFLGRTRGLVPELDTTLILDVGVGEGLFWEGTHAASVVGVDIRPDALAEARTRVGVLAVQGSAFRLPFDDNLFDFVIAVEMLEHLLEPQRAVAELARVSRGVGLVTVPWEPWFSLSVLLGSGRDWRRLGREPEHVQAFGPGELRHLLAAHFPEVEIDTCYPWLVARLFS